MPSLAATRRAVCFPPRRDGPHGSPRLFQYRGWRRLGRAAVEGRLWRIHHLKLDGLCGVVAAQLGREAQGTVDAGRDAGGEDPGAVDDHPLVDGDRTKERQQVKRRPVRRRSAPLEQACRAAEQGARAHRENAARACRLLPDPVQHFGVLHQASWPKPPGT